MSKQHTPKTKKVIAWGRSKLLEFYLERVPEHGIAYVIDSNPSAHGTDFNGLKVMSPETLRDEVHGEYVVAIFAVSTNAITAILRLLNGYGLRLGAGVVLYSDLFLAVFESKVKSILGKEVDPAHYALARSFSLNSRVPVHTTILGNVLFLELLSSVIKNSKEADAIAEVGAFNGGNAILASQFMSMKGERPFHVFGSFEGFPELSKNDPLTKKQGDYVIETSYENILDNFSMFPFVQVHKGFVPKTFNELEKDERYGLVFYDCDLYEPALATYEYFWERMIPGGFMLVHDYVAEKGGFHGVRKATDEFFASKGVQIYEFWENTMALVIKPK